MTKLEEKLLDYETPESLLADNKTDKFVYIIGSLVMATVLGFASHYLHQNNISDSGTIIGGLASAGLGGNTLRLIMKHF